MWFRSTGDDTGEAGDAAMRHLPVDSRGGGRAEQLPVGPGGPGSLPQLPGEGMDSRPQGMEPLNLRDWLVALRRHILLATTVTAAALAVAGYVGYTSPPVYRATSVVRLVDARRALAGGLVDGEEQDAGWRPTNPVLSQVEMLRSRAIAGAVVDDMPALRVRTRGFDGALLKDVYLAPAAQSDSIDLQFEASMMTAVRGSEKRAAAYGAPVTLGGISFVISMRPERASGTLLVISRDVAVSDLAGRLLVKPRESTDFIDITFTAFDPKRAQGVANRVAQVFQVANVETAQQEARRRREFIETQLKFNDSLLTAARAALTAFRNQAPSLAATPPPDRAAAPNPLEERRQELDLERRQYATLLGQLLDTNRVTRRVALRNVIASSPTIGGNAVVSRLYEQLVHYETQRDSLTSGEWARSAMDPDVQRLSTLIASTEADLLGAVRGVVASHDARITVLDDLEARNTATARRLSSTQATGEVLTERVENTRRIADQLSIEYQKARIAEAVEAGQVEVVDLAPLPQVPIGGGPLRTLVYGLLLGLLLGGGSAILADHLNRSVHRRDDVAHLGLPVLGIVPHARRGKTADTGPVVEAMRGIRFSLLYAHGAAGPVMFTITSPGSGEGKSFVSSNLALAFAHGGYRTLLIDADLRRGSLYQILNTQRKPGLTDVLHGEVAVEHAIQATPYASLSFVGCGTRTPDGPELLGSEAMSRFIAGIRASFDAIIVDSPPLGAGVDAYALGAVTGNVLFVLRVGTTNREVAEAKLDLFDRLPVRLLGTVLNDVPGHSPYAQYSYYLDGYGYEAEPEPEPRALSGPQTPAQGQGQG
jgi:capsular exopolysaccharide synthesis family protein